MRRHRNETNQFFTIHTKNHVWRWCNASVIIAMLAALLVSGCAVGPDFIRPEPPMPDAWHQEITSGLTTGEAGLQVWWERFNEPVLNNRIECAATGNFDLTIALECINEARALLGIAAGECFPDVNGNGNITRARYGEDFTAPFFDSHRTDYYSQLLGTA